MNNSLIDSFLAAINTVSYHNAAEGRSYTEETTARNKAKVQLQELKRQMVEQYGVKETLRIASSKPHLAFAELCDLE